MADVMYTEFDDKEVQDFLHNIQSKLKAVENGKKEYYGLLSAIIYQDINDHFAKQEGSEGPWKQWSKSYQAAMQRRGKAGNLILQDSGKMRQNFKPTNVRTTSGGILWFNDAKTKSGFPYAAAHDEGGSTAGRPPKRDFMWLSDKAMDKVAEQTLAFMLDKGI